MRLSLSSNELVSAVLLPAALLTTPLVTLTFLSWQTEVDRRVAPIKREIAQNYSTKWGRCDLVVKWDKDVLCTPKESAMQILWR